jgi:hypothetical protein
MCIGELMQTLRAAGKAAVSHTAGIKRRDKFLDIGSTIYGLIMVASSQIKIGYCWAVTHYRLYLITSLINMYHLHVNQSS